MKIQSIEDENEDEDEDDFENHVHPRANLARGLLFIQGRIFLNSCRGIALWT